MARITMNRLSHRSRSVAVIGAALVAVLLVLALARQLTGPRSAAVPRECEPPGGRETSENLVSSVRQATNSEPDDSESGGWSSDVAKQVNSILDESPSPQEGDLESELVSAWDAILGVVIDEHTRERVPEIDVHLTGIELDQRVRTDETGQFRSLLTGPPRMLHVALYDGGVRVPGMEIASTFGPHRIETPIGPTYPIVLESDASLPSTDWEARLVESRFLPEMPNTLEVLEHGLRVLVVGRPVCQVMARRDVLTPRGGTDVPERQWSWIPFRPNEKGPWVRYSMVEFEPGPFYLPRLEVRNKSAGLEGTAPVEGTAGRQPRVKVTVGEPPPHRACQLAGSVRLLRDGRERSRLPSGGRPRVVLLPSRSELSSSDRPPIFEEKPIWDDGGFRFEHLPPGSRTLLAYAGGYRLEQREIEIVKGENVLPPVELHSSGQSHSPLIVFDETRPEPTTNERYMSLLRLRAAGAYARAWFAGSWHNGNDRSKRWFHHNGLPEAEFMHLGVGSDLLPIWLPNTMYLRPSEGATHLRLVEDWQLVPHGFEVSSAVDEAPLASFRVYFGPIGILSASYEAENATRWKLAGEPLLRFTIWAPGFAPACGTEADFREKSGERIAKVQLQSGWGAVLYFRAGNPNTFFKDPGPWDGWIFPAASHIGSAAAPPIRNVRILMDGELVGRSDNDGMVRIALPERPAHIELDSPGWKLSGAQRLKDVFKVGKGLPHRYLVWMERE